jgi:hypothetical protein
MKVQIKDLYPNPYRDMDNYPINRVKVDALKSSIKQTGFWDNIVARQKDGKIQIAYGHHRLTALREALPWDTEVDIPIKDLPDSTMIQIMANENMQEYSTSPATIDETVKVAKKFLEENPDVILDTSRKSGYSKEALKIAEFLGWGEQQVYHSLQRLNLIESGTVSKTAINELPTDKAARSFAKAVTKWKLPVEEQERVVEQIKESKNFGYDQIEKKVSEARFKTAPPKIDIEKKRREDNVIKFDNYVNDVYTKALVLSRDIDLIFEMKEEFRYLSFGTVKAASDKLSMLHRLKALSQKITNLLINIENEINN